MSVTPEDIAVELGRTAPAEGTIQHQQWSRWIEDALMLIKARLGDLADLDQEKLDYVVRQAVAEHIRHPDDATNVTISVDDASTSRTYRSGSGRVSIRDEWWALLSPSGDSGKAFSVDTAPMRVNGHAWWCSVTFGTSWCSCGAVIGQQPMFEVLE